MILFKNILLNNAQTDVFVEGNRFCKIGKNLNVPAGTEIIDARGNLAILPAFYNTHTHAAMTLCRGFADDMELLNGSTITFGRLKQSCDRPIFVWARVWLRSK